MHAPKPPARRLWRFLLYFLGALLAGASFLAGFLLAPASVHYRITERYTFNATEDAEVPHGRPELGFLWAAHLWAQRREPPLLRRAGRL